MKLDLRPLLAGERLLTFEYLLSADESEEGSVCDLFDASFPSPMKVAGEITNTAGYMRMSVDLELDYESYCARCLAPLSGSFTLNLEKTVATKDMLIDLDEERLDDYVIIEDGFLDIDEQLKEQLELEFPSRFFCKSDCKGLCQRCGKNLNEGKCECPDKEIDPRLLPLQELLNKMKQNDPDNN